MLKKNKLHEENKPHWKKMSTAGTLLINTCQHQYMNENAVSYNNMHYTVNNENV